MKQLELFTIQVLRPPVFFPPDSPTFIVITAYNGESVAFAVEKSEVPLWELADWLESTDEERENHRGEQTK